MFIWYMIYDIYTGFIQLYEVTIEGLFKDNFLFFKDWGSRHIWLNTHLPLCKTHVTAKKKWQVPQKLHEVGHFLLANCTLASGTVFHFVYLFAKLASGYYKRVTRFWTQCPQTHCATITISSHYLWYVHICIYMCKMIASKWNLLSIK